MTRIRHFASTTALVCAVAGSILVAANVGMAALGYAVFSTSSIANVYLLLTTPNSPKSLLWQNLFFICVNVFGLLRHGLGQ